jgi:3-oxoadipate enol-lactonase
MKMLFIPGSGSGRAVWVYQTKYFTDSEAIVFPGHPEGMPLSSVDDYVEWLRGYIQQHRYQDIVLVGHSLGGAIAQLYGLKYADEVKALVLVGTAAKFTVPPATFEALKEMVTDKAAWKKYLEDSYSRVDPEIRQLVIEAEMRIGPEVKINDLRCCDKTDIRDLIHNIKLPTLVIYGSEDFKTPVELTEYLVSSIEGARRVIIDGATHYMFLEKPEEVNQAIEEFLSSIS